MVVTLNFLSPFQRPYIGRSDPVVLAEEAETRRVDWRPFEEVIVRVFEGRIWLIKP
jgi:hypothetical protein